MIRSAITLCRVPEAAAGPFVFHGELESGFRQAAELGYDAVELFLPGPEAFDLEAIRGLQDRYSLAIAAVGTGAGMLRHGLSLTDPDPSTRAAALDFLLRMVERGGQLGAPAILGSMQGRYAGPVSRDQALDWLAEALQAAGGHAASFGVPFLYEPLNRYETNLFNRGLPAAEFLIERKLTNVLLLADLFHFAIEENDIAATLRDIGPLLGHVHWADSNRQAVGFGHTEMAPIAAALGELGYQGYLSAEILPLPDPDSAARQTGISIHNSFPPALLSSRP